MARETELQFNYKDRSWTLGEYTIIPSPLGAFCIQHDGRDAFTSKTLAAAEDWIKRQRSTERRSTNLTLLTNYGEKTTFTGYHRGSGLPIIGGEQHSGLSTRYYADTPESQEALLALRVANENVTAIQDELEHWRVRFNRSIHTREVEDMNEALAATEEVYKLALKGESPAAQPRDWNIK
jgi:hypothetical protein